MFDLFRKLKYILPAADKVKLIILFGLMVAGGVLEVVSIGLIAGFVSVVADAKILLNIEALAPVLEFLNIKTSRDILVYGSIFLIIVFILKNAYIVFYKYLKSRFIYNRYRSISFRLFKTYMNTPYVFHLRRNSADLIRNISTEVLHLASGVMLPILGIATEGVMVLGIVILLFAVEPIVTLITLVFLGGISLLFLKIIRGRIIQHGKKALKERAGLIKTISEGIGGLKDVLIMNRQNWFIERFHQSIATLTKANIFRETTKQSVRPVMETVAVCGMLIIAIVLLWEGRSIASLVSVLALFALSIQRLLPAMNNIVSEYNVVRYNSCAVDPIYHDLKNAEKQVKEAPAKKFAFRDKIEVVGIDYSYPQSSETVLKDVSLAIPSGSAIGIVGATGCGKTTLVDVILGLLVPQKGSVKADGKDIRENLKGWQKNIGYIPQAIFLSDNTIRNNVAFGIPEKEIDEKRVAETVKVAQLDEFINRLPKGLDAFIGERGIRLSGGQKQRIGIARALYSNPEILIMDEATSSLDNITEKFVIEAIERLKEERTLIIIAHRLTTVKNCDKLYVMKSGKIIAEGSYDELLQSNGEFKLMAGLAE